MTRLPVLNDEASYLEERPRTRGECANGPRPCPWVSCRHHFAEVRADVDGELIVRGERLAAKESRSAVEAFTDRMAAVVATMRDSCVLDIVDRYPDGATLQEAADTFDLTRERVRQIEGKAARRAMLLMRAQGLR